MHVILHCIQVIGMKLTLSPTCHTLYYHEFSNKDAPIVESSYFIIEMKGSQKYQFLTPGTLE